MPLTVMAYNDDGEEMRALNREMSEVAACDATRSRASEFEWTLMNVASHVPVRDALTLPRRCRPQALTTLTRI